MRYLVVLVLVILTGNVLAQEIPGAILSQIRRKAADQWANDYQMQKYEIDTQTKSYRELQTITGARVPPANWPVSRSE